MTERAYLNGEIVESDRSGLALNERGFLLGDAAFETMRWSEGTLRRWDRHRARLEAGLAYLGISVPDLDAIPGAAQALVSASHFNEAVLRLTISGGVSAGFERQPGTEPTVVLTCRPRPTPPSSLSLAVLPGARRANVPSSRFKLAGYADNIAARREARAAGADMAVMLGAQGQPACCDTANLFWIDNSDRVFTPGLDAGALPGTTRAAILAAAAGAGLQIVEASAETPALGQAVAACVTNAVMGAVPVASVDGRALDARHSVLQALIELEATAL